MTRPALITVTPALARSFLDATTLHLDQCGIRCGSRGEDHLEKVGRYADVMLAGQWQPVAPLVFTGPGGSLVDGLHRILAVIESGCTVVFPLAYIR